MLRRRPDQQAAHPDWDPGGAETDGGQAMSRSDSTLVVEHDLDDNALADLRAPRDDVVAEQPLGDGRYGLFHGPFSHYERTLEVTPGPGPANRHRVTERFTWRLAIPVWHPLFAWPMRRALRRPATGTPWWAPPDRFDARAARILGLLACIQVVDGYLGTVITQTITFAADEFDRSDTAQGATLAAVRLGVLVALAVVVLADRRGRRRLLMGTATLAVLVTALGAFSPGLWFLGSSQMVARGLTTGMGILIGVFAAEELPRGSRAYGVSMLALAAALGAGMAVWVLPLADLGEKGWRIVYLVPLLALPGLAAAGSRLPESRRFRANTEADPSSGPGTGGDRSADRRRTEQRRLLLLAAAAFLLLFFAAPASQFQNDFLKDHRGYSASGIALYTLLTSTPAGIGIFAAGRLADTRGRRRVGAVGLVAGTVFLVAGYYAFGVLMWASHLVGVVLASLTVALGVYGPELFSTRSRARANGVIVTLGVAGSATGLLLVGALADAFGSYGHALAVAGVGPLLCAVLVLTRFPETARVELETLNPGDVRPGES